MGISLFILFILFLLLSYIPKSCIIYKRLPRRSYGYKMDHNKTFRSHAAIRPCLFFFHQQKTAATIDLIATAVYPCINKLCHLSTQQSLFQAGLLTYA